uniref:Uncharacterized protein n=1 Tax=Romanomermis culicivorax TaxID=13658 RepID=A0A915L8V9_ROMCU
MAPTFDVRRFEWDRSEFHNNLATQGGCLKACVETAEVDHSRIITVTPDWYCAISPFCDITMFIVSKISRTSLKLLDDLIKLYLITDKALDTEAVSDIDRDRAKTPGGDLDDDGDKSVASDGSAISTKSFSSTKKRHHPNSHGLSVIDDTPREDAPASKDPQA